MDSQTLDIEDAKAKFATAFVSAVSVKSASGIADLMLSPTDFKTLGSELNESESAYREACIEACEAFLSKHAGFVAERSKTESAIDTTNIVKTSHHRAAVDQEQKSGSINIVSISLRSRIVGETRCSPYIQLNDVLVVDGKLKLPTLASVRISESKEPNITKDNTPYELVRNKAKLKGIIAPHVNRSMLNLLDQYNDWYVHEGDLTLEKMSDVKVNLIVTGDLVVKEPVAVVTYELIVLGKTSVNALFLPEDNDVLLLGGVHFEIAALVSSSGPIQIFRRPRGPLLYAASESLDVDDPKDVQCFYAPDLDGLDDLSGILSERFLVQHEYEGEVYYEVDTPKVLDAIRSGEPIFIPSN